MEEAASADRAPKTLGMVLRVEDLLDLDLLDLELEDVARSSVKLIILAAPGVGISLHCQPEEVRL